MSEFIKDRDIIMPMPKGLAYDLKKGKIYRLKTIRDMFSSKDVLIEDGTLNIPQKVYYTEKDQLLIDRILHFHKTTDKNTTGVLFHGIQGCGKTLMAKIIADKCELPIIIVDPSFYTSHLMNFFTKFSTEVVILFDELDKHCGKEDNWNTKDLLEFLDGVQETSKKLVVFTCNSDKNINEFLKDRCGRIRYYKKFNILNHDTIFTIVEDNLIDKTKTADTTNFIETFMTILSYDNIIALCKEINDWPDQTIETLVEDLNIQLK